MSRRGKTFCALAAFSLALASVAFAADDNKVIFPSGPGAARPEASASAGGSTLNTFTLLLALALAGVGGWLFWRNRRRVTGAGTAQALAISETRSLGNRQYLVVASYEGKKFLLGVCPGRIDMLAPLDGSATQPEKRP